MICRDTLLPCVDGYVDIVDVVVVVVVATFVCYNSRLLFLQKLPGQGNQKVQPRELLL